MSWMLVTGFGPFENVEDNPSARLARALERHPPPGLNVLAGVLPVSFERAPRALAELLETSCARLGPPALLLGLGVKRKGASFHVELCARRRLERPDRTDVDGRAAAEIEPARHPAESLRSGLERRLVEWVEGRPHWHASEDAGGYVCEWTYRHLLERGDALGAPAAFVHVPRAERRDLAHQEEDLRAFVERLLEA